MKSRVVAAELVLVSIGMRARTALSVSLLFLSVASQLAAQPKRGARAPAAEKAEKAKPSGAASAVEKPSAAAPVVAADPNADAELGAPPPKAAATEGEVKEKASPLTPAPDEFPKGEQPAVPVDLDRVLAEIAALRSRVAALTTTLFKSKLRVAVEAEGDDARIESLTVTLDDGVIFAAPERFSASDARVVYEHAVAPGQHVIGIDIERADARNPQYRTWQTSRFSVVVPESQLLHTEFRIGDDSDMAADFPEDKSGEYDLSVRLRARVIKP